MFEILEHTADVGFRVRGKDRGELFVEAARALISLLLDNPEAVRLQRWVECDLSAARDDDLLLDWLDALLHWYEGEHLVLSQFELSLQGGHLQARAGGEPLDPARHQLRYEIKAITYHGLEVRQEPDGWTATVIVDI